MVVWERCSEKGRDGGNLVSDHDDTHMSRNLRGEGGRENGALTSVRSCRKTDRCDDCLNLEETNQSGGGFSAAAPQTKHG